MQWVCESWEGDDTKFVRVARFDSEHQVMAHSDMLREKGHTTIVYPEGQEG